MTCGNSRIGGERPRQRLEPSRGVENTWMRGVLMTQRTCDLDGCNRPHSSKGYCAPHYARWRRTGDVGPVVIAEPAVGGECSVGGCSRRRKALSYCQPHYNRWYKSGDVGAAEVRDVSDPCIRDENGCKRCTRCKGWRSEDQFLRFDRSPDGLHSHCYRCHRSRVLFRKYGITIDQYESILSAQGGVCAICKGVNKGGQFLAVDHDHACCAGGTSCGRCARALLCTRCNTGLGAFGDDLSLLAAAACYIQRFGAASG